MSDTATIVGNVDAADGEWIARFKAMEIPAVTDTVGENGGSRVNSASCTCLAGYECLSSKGGWSWMGCGSERGRSLLQK